MKVKKKPTLSEINKCTTLDKFFNLHIIEKFAFIPPEDFAMYPFGEFNGHKVSYYAINGRMCFNFASLAQYAGIPPSTVRKAFSRIVKKTFSNNLPYFVEGQDFFKVKRNTTKWVSDEKSLSHDLPKANRRGEKLSDVIFLTFTGIGKILPSFNSELPIQMWHWIIDRMGAQIEGIQLQKGEMYLTNYNGEIIAQELGDPERNFVDCHGYRYSSKAEMIIGMVLSDLKVRFQPNAPINFSREQVEQVKKKTPSNILQTAGYDHWFPDYITADFLLRTIPKTAIEYWGLKDAKYLARKQIKEIIYVHLKIKLISVNPGEAENKPMLKKRLAKELNLVLNALPDGEN
jgi:hypothetical protein